MVNVIVAQLPGHSVLQPGHVPRLAAPGAATAYILPFTKRFAQRTESLPYASLHDRPIPTADLTIS